MKRLSLALCFVFLAGAFAKDVRVVFSRTTPPYVIDHGNGIVVDIARESLAVKGHTLKPIFTNIARGLEMFKSGLADANPLVIEGIDVNGYYSKPFMTYHNKAFSLKSSKLDLKKMESLLGQHIIGFQNARLYLGDRFGKVAKDSGEKYTEYADQKTQTHMLYEGRTGVVVMDANIFYFYTEMLKSEGKIDHDIPVVEHDFFEPTSYQVVFRDKGLRDDFDAGIKRLKESGRYKQIFENYGKKYFRAKK